jgi:uncharacterized Fe-S radical SAM superfamily protein PflX
MMLELQDRGCHNINFVTPEHVVPQILQALPAAIDGGLRLPIVYNTSCYDSLDSLALMDGIVDIYLPDLKPAALRRGRAGPPLAAGAAPGDARDARRNPGDLAAELGTGTYVDLMAQYHPAGAATSVTAHDRQPTGRRTTKPRPAAAFPHSGAQPGAP